MSQAIDIKRIAEEFVALNIRPTYMKGVDDIVVYEMKEVDCGWVCFWDILPWIEPYRINAPSSGRDIPINEPIMVNRYTYTPSRFEMSNFPNLESAIRHYVNGLPLWQQVQNKDLQIHEPVEFYPPTLYIGGLSVIEDVKDAEFYVRVDTRFYDVGDDVQYAVSVEDKEGADVLLKEIATCADHIVELKYRVIFNRRSIERKSGFIYNRIWFCGRIITPDDDSPYKYYMMISGYVSEMVPPFLRRPGEDE